jgi:hypothetical protein
MPTNVCTLAKKTKKCFHFFSLVKPIFCHQEAAESHIQISLRPRYETGNKTNATGQLFINYHTPSPIKEHIYQVTQAQKINGIFEY